MEKKPMITWQLWAVLGGLVFLVVGVIRPAVCGRAWQAREASDPILADMERKLKAIGVEPVETERPGGFCG